VTVEGSVTEISSISSAVGTTSTSDVDYKGEISPEQFLDILIAELQNQNPLEPMKNNELMQQMTQIKSLQATSDLVEQLTLLSDGMELGSAASLIGKLVSGTAANGQTVQGKVEGLIVENDTVNLVVAGFPLLPLSNVEQVTAETAAEEGGDGQ